MPFLPAVFDAKYVQGNFIHIRFNDGTEKTIDFSQWLNGRSRRRAISTGTLTCHLPI